MSKTKSGWQYSNTFRGELVVKTKLSPIASCAVRAKANPRALRQPVKLYRRAVRGLTLADECRRMLVDRRDLWALFSLVRIDKGRIHQNYLRPLREVLGADPHVEERAVRDYFEFVAFMIAKGVFEYTFNPFDNYGYDADGKVRLIDVGEFCTDKRVLIDKIVEGTAVPPTLRPFQFPRSRELFCQLHEDAMCVDYVEAHWPVRR